MSKVTEDPVETTETVKHEGPTGRDAFAAARASLPAQSTDQAPVISEPLDDTPEKKTVEEPEKVADQPEKTTEDPEDTLLTADEVSKLNPKERGLYEKAQKNYTLKTQKLAADRKELEQWKPLIDQLTTNPDAAIEQLAQQRGMKLSKAAQDNTVEKQTEATLAELPEELAFLKPVFEAYGKKLMDTMRGEITPLKEGYSAIVSEAAAAETEATLKSFEAKYPGWQKHEKAMLDMGQKILPGKGMSDFEYMEILHRQVTAGTDEAERTKKTVEKINKSAAASESPTPGIANSRVEHALPPPDKRDIKAAWEAAKRGEVWTE